jgi:hypothetical protein
VEGEPRVKIFAGKLVSMQKKIESDEDEFLEEEHVENKDKKKGFSLFSSKPKKKKPKPKKVEKEEEKDENKEEKKTDNLNAYFESIDKKLSL